MKKILLFTSIVLLTFSVKVYAQSITNVTITNSIDCFGGFGEITVEITSSPPPGLEVMAGYFPYSWNTAYFVKQGSIAVVGGNTSITIPGLFAGDYTIRLVNINDYYAANPFGNGDALNGMLDQYSTVIILDEPDPLLATTDTISGNLCFGDCIAEEDLTITGGTKPYSFTSTAFPPDTLAIGDSVYSFDSLCAGNYDIIVTDINGCPTLNTPAPANTTSFTILEPSGIIPGGLVTSSYNGMFNVSCYDSANGEITAMASGGTGVIECSIDGAIFHPNPHVFSGLSAGPHTITYRNTSGGCDTTETLILTKPPALSGTLSITQAVVCFGVCDGEIEFTVDGTQVGVPSYEYSIDNGVSFHPNQPNFQALCGDSAYDVIIRDLNHCQYTASIYLPAPNSLSYSLSITDYNGFEISCNGDNDGQITINNPTGGTSPYTYSSDGGISYGSNNSFPNLIADTMTIVVKDFEGCTADTIINMLEPGMFTLSDVLTDSNKCPGDCDGEITITPSNGIGQILYNINAGTQQLSSIFPGLCGGGNDTVAAVDANGCVDTVIVPVAAPPPFIYSLDSVADYCYLEEGEASITVTSGGTGGYLYAWNDASSQQTALAVDLPAATYTVTVTDGLGCQFSESIILPLLPGFSVSFTTVSPCLGDSSGSATVSPVGSSSYSYQWFDSANDTIPGETSSTISNMPIGQYWVAVEDLTDGCLVTGDTNIVALTNPIILDSIIVTNSSCYDIDDAQIEMFASGGPQPIYYSINNGLTSTINPIFDSLAPNTYTLKAFDANLLCFDDTVITLSYPNLLEIDSTGFTHISCFGADDGAVQDIQVVGGTGPFTFTIDGVGIPQTYITFSGLDPGLHTVEVFDANNCTSGDIIIINEPTLFEVAITASNWNNYQIICNDDSSGYINITALGGTIPYLSLTDSLTFSSTTTIDSLWAGNHIFIVEDANGCNYTETIMFNEPNPIQHNFITNHVSCVAWNNGSVTDSVYGGVGSATTYSYLWSTGETTYSLANKAAGTYTITVTDEHGCTDTESVIINATNAFNADSLGGVKVDCFDDCDGELSVTASGGTSPYNYLWNDYLEQTGSTAVGLCVDSISLFTVYDCIVTDASGCDTTIHFTLTQPAELQVDISIENSISCNGLEDGKLKANVTGGTLSYTYSWSNGVSNSLISNLPPGIYKVTVEDANTCRDTFEILLNEPTPVEISIEDSAITCFGFNDGSIQALASGGTSFEHTYLYTLYLQGAFEDSITHIAGTVAQDSLEFNSLAPGNYYVIAKDRNGCEVTSLSVEITEPFAPLTLLVDTVDETCLLNDGIIRMFPEGGSQSFNYFIDGDSTLNNSNIIGGNAPGWYAITVIDTRGCEINDVTFIKDYRKIFLPDTISSIDTTICLGQSITIDVDERPDLTYTWDDGVLGGDRIIMPEVILAHGENATVYYTLTITDLDGCEQENIVEVTYSVVDPMIDPVAEAPWPVVLGGGNIELSSNNNDGVEYTWMWSNDTITNSNGEITARDLLSSDWYYLHMKDANGCLGYDSIYVVVGVKTYEYITPNGDIYNQKWLPEDIDSYPDALLQVFNRWGSLVWEASGVKAASDGGWQGKDINDKELPVGTYYYIIDLNTGDEPQTGPITIVR